MSKNRISIFIFLLCIFIIISHASFSDALKFKSKGSYVDSAGTTHIWQINEYNTLIWNNQPYIPVGGIFESRYLSNEHSEENYQADITALNKIKESGITDIILKSTKQITQIDKSSFQKIIDYLDSNGFTYGLEINETPERKLTGFYVSPNLYRLEGPSEKSIFTFQWPDVVFAVYIIVDKLSMSIISTGAAVVSNGTVTINISGSLGRNDILLVYPQKTVVGENNRQLGDLWSGYGELRDRLLMYFKDIKFGQGLRFFLEPFDSKMDFQDDMQYFVPDSQGFNLGFEAYLARKYQHEGVIDSAWGLLDNISSIEKASRLVPLWSGGRGISQVYDWASGAMYPVDFSSSKIWQDILDYRDISVQEYMNSIADAIKKNIADVPVIFNCNSYHRIYLNPFGIGGFDGLGIQAYGTDEAPSIKSGGPTFSLADNSAKTMWLITSSAQTSKRNKIALGYPDENTFKSTMISLKEVGSKGFYIDSLQVADVQNRANFNLVDSSEQLGWISNFKAKEISRGFDTYKPTYIPFPSIPQTGAYVKRLKPNTWWLPTLTLGKAIPMGDEIFGYSLFNSNNVFLWTSAESKTISLKNTYSGEPRVIFPSGRSIKKGKNDFFSVVLDNSPTEITGFDPRMVFPKESAEIEIRKLEQALPIADRTGKDVKAAKELLNDAKKVLENGHPIVANEMAQTQLEEFRDILPIPIWLEGESATVHSFTRTTAAHGASGGLCLLLDTDKNYPMTPYNAQFVFNSYSQSSYELWFAATPPNEGSIIRYSIDGANWNTLTSMDNIINYAPGLAWYKVNNLNLFPGKHTITIRAESPRAGDTSYYFALDAVVLSPGQFQPNGIIKPGLVKR
ncbi:MAG: hypothetical protein SNJ70_02555 [Armatimonadota bacterium]